MVNVGMPPAVFC